MAKISVSSPSGDLSGTRYERDHVACQVKRTWEDAWVEAPYLCPAWWRDSAPPGVSQAELRIHYGTIKREDASAFAAESPAEYIDLYLRIQITNSLGTRTVWVGIIADQVYNVQGTSGGVPSGATGLAAYGLEHLLDREHVDGAYADQGGTVVKIGTDVTFNRRRKAGLGISGNSSNTKDPTAGPAGAYPFGADGAVWTNKDIAEYLLGYFGPDGITFQLTGQADILDNFRAIHRLAGKSVFQCLNHLISRRRSVGWRVATTGEGTVGVDVFSLLGEAISVGDITIPANPIQLDVALDDQLVYQEAVVELAATLQYETVVVRGEPIQVCFSASKADETLDNAWTAEEETAYKAGDTSVEDEGADGAADAHDRERATAKFERVYQMFKIPADWDWAAGNGVGGEAYNAALAFGDDGRLIETEKATYWNAGRRLRKELPLAKPAADANAEPEFQDPVVVIKDPSGRYLDFTRVDPRIDNFSPGKFRVTDAEFGFVVEGRLNHILGLNHFDPEAVEQKSGVKPQFDHDELIVTVAAETDHRIQVTVRRPTGEEHETGRTMVLDVPDACYWRILPGTVTGVTNGALVHRHEDFVLRDDSERLRQLAALASAYYSRRRARLKIRLSGFWGLAVVGTYINNVSSCGPPMPVGAVVTSRLYTNGDERTVAMETGYAELDIGGLVDVPGLSDARAVGRTILDQQAQLDEVTRELASKPEREHTPNVTPRWLGQIVDTDPWGGAMSNDTNVYGVKRVKSKDTTDSEWGGITHEFVTDVHPAHVMATNEGEAPDEHALTEVAEADGEGRVIVEVGEVRDQGVPPARRYYFRRSVTAPSLIACTRSCSTRGDSGATGSAPSYSVNSVGATDHESRLYFKFPAPIPWNTLERFLAVRAQLTGNIHKPYASAYNPVTGYFQAVDYWLNCAYVTEDFATPTIAWASQPAVTGESIIGNYRLELNKDRNAIIDMRVVESSRGSLQLHAWSWSPGDFAPAPDDTVIYGIRLRLTYSIWAGPDTYHYLGVVGLANGWYATGDLFP